MTLVGALVGLIFVACYLGMAVSTGMEGSKAKAVQWGCWLVACVVMLICYSITPDPAG
tara:strand:- start:166 stop:339 length:174 start_codon:yes stop_codon:yes gene_type:complete